ncbi:cytochrome ubiquinol oxidase subunit I, partial [Vibrio anguillarum]|uniref:cytochrome ubiquinol oxidase subunit I n=1 Tax=Vibrio anguillarum TaxID=55601 RepID=UPI00188C95EE
MEATFLGVMLFGRGRVPEWVHTLATVLVAIGTSLSAFWILVLNSWMHTPAGYEVIEGIVHVTSWKEVIFNPSMPYRLAHMLLASLLTASFVIAGISAYQFLRNSQLEAAKVGLRVGIILAAIAIPIQIFVGDLHGLNTLKHQPAKIAAMEGVWDTEQGASLLLFAWPDEATRSNHFELGIPKLASLILTHDLDGEIVGLNQFAPDHPPVKPLFFGFRIMVGIGVLMLLV